MVPRIFKNLDFKFATHYVWLKGTVGKMWVQPDFKANELYRRTFLHEKFFSQKYTCHDHIHMQFYNKHFIHILERNIR
jgi:hypothetical protein